MNAIQHIIETATDCLKDRVRSDVRLIVQVHPILEVCLRVMFQLFNQKLPKKVYLYTAVEVVCTPKRNEFPKQFLCNDTT